MIGEIGKANVFPVEIYGLSEHPNLIHKLLATQASKGHIVSTTSPLSAHLTLIHYLSFNHTH